LVNQLPLIGVFLLGIMRLLPSLTFMGQLRMEVAGLAGDAQVLHRAFTQTLARQEGGSLKPVPLRQAIVLEGIEFAYPNRPPLFKDLTVRFEKGEMTALVGSSGSGKTTLVSLLLGFLRPQRGQILLDGADLWRFYLPAWRAQIGFVSQEGFVFHASVRENILFGRSGFSDADLHQAAEAANARAFIEALPQGYETVVGERGMKLSGGQQQRIAIARAILHHPEILIFDEATSALDAESERLVREAMERTSRNRTVIVIAHRLTTVSGADRIVVLDHGRVAEQGTREELLNAGGRYAQLAATEVGG
jgi:ABC-type multidrug transport system fused ATPase/permease subunit